MLEINRGLAKMVLRVLVETGFMLALNPRDKHHEWAMKILEEAKKREILLYISPTAPIELSLIMKSKGYEDKDIARVLNAIDVILEKYVKPQYPQIRLKELVYATELRIRYPELTFFDSIHAATAIINNLTYYDFDQTIKNIIANEMGSTV